jgi:hypothetical protein
MEQPPSFIENTRPDHVCKLHKAIYGLKRAPQAWFTKLSNFLLNLGFKGSLVDTFLFIYLQGSIHIYMLVYVDDILLAWSHPSIISLIITLLQAEFPLKDLRPLHYFLGIQVTRDTSGVQVCQSKYISELLHKTNMHESKLSKSPCTSSSKFSRLDGPAFSYPTIYRQVVGALQYCTLTQPEIAYSVNQLCQHMHAPITTHWIVAKRVLRYLNGSITHCLYFAKCNLQLNAFCDFDWASCPDDYRFTLGFVVFLGICLIAWSAKKQAVVSRSSTEAEYRSLSITTAEFFWLRMLFKNSRFFFLHLLSSGVTMLVPWPWLPTQSFMLTQSTLKWITTLFVRRYSTMTSLLSSFHGAKAVHSSAISIALTKKGEKQRACLRSSADLMHSSADQLQLST